MQNQNKDTKPTEAAIRGVGNIQVAERLLAALDREAAARDFEDRDALVNAILSTWVSHAEDEAARAIYTRSVLKKELSGDENGGERGVVYEMALREVGVATKPRKHLYIRRQVRGFTGEYLDKRTITFPIGGAAWVRETLLPWLAEGLKEAEAVHRTEVSQNRRKAQARRAARTVEEKAREADMRSLYSERFGKGLWEYAVSQASRHRARGERRGLTEHFTPAEWLYRAALSDFKCPLCGADAPLETHHCRALSAGGDNTMANVQLLCAACHIKVAQRGEDGGDEWYAQEIARMDMFKVGDSVRRRFGVRATERGVVQEILPPKRGDGPLWCQRAPLSDRDGMGGKLMLPREPLRYEYVENGYEPTQVRVLWTRDKGRKPNQETAQLREIELCPPPDSDAC